MNQRPNSRAFPLRCQHQRGALLIALVIAMGLIGLGAGLMVLKRQSVALTAEQQTAGALAYARDALIGYAVSRGSLAGTARPGELPCPDIDNDGRADTPCAAGRLGRLPWATIGIPAPKDSAGETLWYAVAAPFRDWGSNAQPINSDTLGNITVYGTGSAGAITSRAVAVLLAPGAATGNQIRDLSVQSCAATTTVMARNTCPSNYLEAYGSANNAAANGPFIAIGGKLPSGINDRVAYIRTSDMIPAVEQRVASELRELLLQYRQNATCNCYPWAGRWAELTGQSTSGINWGRFPTTALPVNWGTGKVPPLPQWVAANDWQQVIYYSAGKGQLENAGLACTLCSANGALTVTGGAGAGQVSAVLLTPGTPRTGVTRPSTALADYLEDSQNNHPYPLTCGTAGSIGAACDAYAQPSAVATDRDRLFAMTTTAPAITLTCGQTAAVLASIARSTTCGGPGNSVIASCQAAKRDLATCGCSAAATTLTKPPCYNVSNKPHPPGQCVTALQLLDACS